MRATIVAMLFASVGPGCRASVPSGDAHVEAFRSSIVRPFQEAFAAVPAVKVYDWYVTTRDNDAATEREGVVCVCRGSGGGSEKRPYQGRAIDVAYDLRGGEWVFKSAVEREIKDGRSEKKSEFPGDGATIPEVVAWVRKALE
jgi:hypothetical protein